MITYDSSRTQNIPKEAWEADKAYRLHLAIIPEDEGGFSVLVVNLPGAGSQGETEAEGIANAKDAAQGVIESYLDAGEEIPWENEVRLDPALGDKIKYTWVSVNV